MDNLDEEYQEFHVIKGLMGYLVVDLNDDSLMICPVCGIDAEVMPPLWLHFSNAHPNFVEDVEVGFTRLEIKGV